MRVGFRLSLAMMLACVATACGAQGPVEEPEGRDIKGPDGAPWLRLMTPEYDRKNREGTYKTYTHLLDFNGEGLLTKGAGGKFSHHRGLYIGWNKTQTEDREYDSWHMKNCFQQLNGEVAIEETDDAVHLSFQVDWRPIQGEAFVREDREHHLFAGPNGARIVDFVSTLHAIGGPIALRGDLQHAGMQIRLANEVSEHEETTEYILPEGAEELDDDKVVGAWWVTCSAIIEGKRYWFVHMTAPDLPGGVPVYSIRRYARFGAFFEPDLAPDTPMTLRFRVVASEEPLDQAASQALYDAYVASLQEKV